MENYREAQEKGYFEGSQQAKVQSESQINNMMGQLKTISDILVEQKTAIINSSQNMIIDMATEIAKKVVDENFSKNNNDAFLAVFENAVRNMPPAEKLIVTVSDRDYKIMTFDAQKLLELAPGFKNIEIRCDTNADVGTLTLENSIMVVDASVSTQINMLKQEILSVL
ncbi:MAG: FliH/SctL family protein [Oscillospiraceae bacterium]|nr:FliH/SctL family protein [Oscillospiraceae bacterium]